MTAQGEVPSLRCPVPHRTPSGASHFFGYHDLCPWRPGDRGGLLVHRVERERREVPEAGESADIYLWRPSEDALSRIAGTRTWNWQQGARLQWHPTKEGVVVYNDRRDGKGVAVLRKCDTGEERLLDGSVYSLSGDGRFAVAPSFGRLGRYWEAYGYQGLSAPDIDQDEPEADGLWLTDMETGSRRLLLSIRELNERHPLGASSSAAHILTHPVFSPDDEKICFLHRFTATDGALYTRLFTLDRSTGDLHLLAEGFVSHFTWYDDRHLIVWRRVGGDLFYDMRRQGVLGLPGVAQLVRFGKSVLPSLKDRVARRGYFIQHATQRSNRRQLLAGRLEEDGHPSLSPDGKLVATDTYPDSSGQQWLYLVDPDKDRAVRVGRFPAPKEYRSVAGKCDLHPRWDRSGRWVSVDSTCTGRRQMHLVDVSKGRKALGASH